MNRHHCISMHYESYTPDDLKTPSIEDLALAAAMHQKAQPFIKECYRLRESFHLYYKDLGVKDPSAAVANTFCKLMEIDGWRCFPASIVFDKIKGPSFLVTEN